MSYPIKPLGEICEISTGSTDTKDATENGQYPLFDRSKKIKASDKYLFDCEALIMPGEGAEFLPRHYIGKFDLHQRAYAMFNFSKLVDPQYLYFYLIFVKDYFANNAVGATVKSLRRRHFTDLEIPLPPLEKQRELVDMLRSAFAEIDQLEWNLGLLDSLVVACDVSILDQILTVDSSQQDSHRSSSLGEVTELISRGIAPSYLDTADTVVINQRCIRDGHVNFDSSRRHDEKTRKVQGDKLLRDGDGLINSTGVGTLGRTALFKNYESRSCTVDSHVTIVRPMPEILNSDYFGLVLKALENVFVSLSTGTSGQTELPREAIKETYISFPIALADQRDFYEYYSSINSSLNATRKLLVERRTLVSELRKSLLSAAFTQEKAVV